MLDLVPLARPRREVADTDDQFRFIGEALQLQFPRARTVSVASPSVRSDEELGSIRVRSRSHGLPPLPNRGDGKGWGVGGGTHPPPSLVTSHVVDAVRDCLPQSVLRKIVDQRLLRHPLRLPLVPSILEIADQLLLLGIHRDNRLSAPHASIGGRVDALKLSVAIGVSRTFAALAHRLEAIAEVIQQPTHRRRTHRPSLRAQSSGELRSALACPPQRRPRVAAREWIDQL